MAKFWKTTRHEDTTEKHQITTEEIKFLSNLQKEMNTQDNVGQASPRYWTIRDYKRIYGKDLQSPDGIAIYDDETCDTIYEGEISEETKPEIIKALQEYIDNNQEIEDKIQEALENNDIPCLPDAFDTLEEYVEDYCELELLEYSEYPFDSGMFFTHDAAIEHLKKNAHHYADNAHTYAHTSWRSKEEPLWSILESIDWSKIPTSK